MDFPKDNNRKRQILQEKLYKKRVLHQKTMLDYLENNAEQTLLSKYERENRLNHSLNLPPTINGHICESFYNNFNVNHHFESKNSNNTSENTLLHKHYSEKVAPLHELNTKISTKLINQKYKYLETPITTKTHYKTDLNKPLKLDTESTLSDLKNKYLKPTEEVISMNNNPAHIPDIGNEILNEQVGKKQKRNHVLKTPRVWNEIRAASLVCPILLRDPPEQDLRLSLNNLGIHRDYLKDSGFEDCLASLGEELIKKSVATKEGENISTDLNPITCFYCGFRTESSLVISHHLDNKHEKRLCNWPFTKRLYF